MNIKHSIIVLTLLAPAVATALLAPPAHADKLPDPPSATITAPMDGEMFDGAPAIVDVELDVFTGTGVASIDLWVDDASVAQDTDAPWGFTDVELSEGMHSIYVVVNDLDGVGYPSEAISVAVIAGGETGGSDGGSDGGSETAGEGSSGGTDGEGGGGGKNCSVGEHGDLGGLLGLGLVGLVILGATRRREG